ncbi:MAG: type II toxin-antitoxin system RelE/ParE family toxin [Bacteroidia bacterium]|nr:type II toxin-antitoxin system RelE/ParE family toxin [Bacteroidia bacterium]
MAHRVYLSPLAQFKLESILETIERKWGKKSKQKFLYQLSQATERISNYPELWAELKEYPGIRKCVITKQTSYFYRILNENIEIITVIDNRQNPAKTWKEITNKFT